MIYRVEVNCPPIHEIVVTSAEDEQQAKERAVYSAGQRALKAGTVAEGDLAQTLAAGEITCVELPDGTPDEDA
jgi:hypothetical protein